MDICRPWLDDRAFAQRKRKKERETRRMSQFFFEHLAPTSSSLGPIHDFQSRLSFVWARLKWSFWIALSLFFAVYGTLRTQKKEETSFFLKCSLKSPPSWSRVSSHLRWWSQRRRRRRKRNFCNKRLWLAPTALVGGRYQRPCWWSFAAMKPFAFDLNMTSTSQTWASQTLSLSHSTSPSGSSWFAINFYVCFAWWPTSSRAVKRFNRNSMLFEEQQQQSHRFFSSALSDQHKSQILCRIFATLST